MSESEPLRKPIIVSMPDAPTFVGTIETGKHFCCASCDKPIIQNYIETSFIDIGFKCLRCENITYTPAMPLGDVLATRVCLISNRSYLIAKPVPFGPGVVLIGEGHAADVLLSSMPRFDPKPKIDLTEAGRHECKQQYIELMSYRANSRRKLEAQERAIRMNKPCAKQDFPFLWALERFQTIFQAGSNVDITEYENSGALMMYYLFNHSVSVWKHNPRFPEVAFGLTEPGKFIHTASQLLLASCMWIEEMQVGLTLENNHNQPNPDLYIKGAGKPAILFCEVKAPRALQWQTKQNASLQLVTESVINQITRSKRQIDRDHPGLLCITSTKLEADMSATLKNAIVDALGLLGKERPHLDKVIGITPAMAEMTTTRGDPVLVPVAWDITYTENDHFEHNRFFKVRSESLKLPT